MGSRALSECSAKEGRGKKKMKKTRVNMGKRKFGERGSDPRFPAARSKSRKKQKGFGEGRRRGGGTGSGPRLPAGIKRELASLARIHGDDASDSDDESTEKQHPGDSVYEYDEPLPQEETKMNRRFDPVENFEFELPEDFQDEEIEEELASVGGSGDEEDDDLGSFREVLKRPSTFKKRGSDENDDVRGEDDDEYDGEDEEQVDEGEETNDYDDDDPERHSRLLQEITGLPRGAFEQKALSSKSNLQLEDASGLNEAKSDGTISIQDLLDPLYGKAGYSSLRKRMRHLEQKSEPVRAPLPKVIQEKLDRTAAYKLSKDDITKWEPLVKKNREAPTLYFGEEVHARVPTVGEIASEFKPRTSLEQKISSILGNANVVEAHMKDGAMLLELNRVSVESVRERQNRLAKLRSLLFRHEMKAKHLKKIKSKTYHRILKKNKLKSNSIDVEMDPEAAKEHAMKQEFKRAEERMTLKHKNSSKWARRILKRGLNAQDEGTRIAISEQLNQHALLTRKMNSMKDNSSSDSSTDEEEASASEDDQVSKLLESAKDKTMKLIEEKEEIPKSGLLSLPFMVRGMEKKKEAVYEEARHALDEYDLSLDPTNGSNGSNAQKNGVSSRIMVFGDAKRQSPTSMSKVKRREFSQALNSEDDEGECGSMGNDNACPDETRAPGNVEIDPTSLLEDLGIHHDPVLKSSDDLKRKSGPKTTFEVSICASESLVQRCDNVTQDSEDVKAPETQEQNCHQNREEAKQLACSDNADETEEDNQSVESASDYELPSMQELIKRAFASDDVEEEFEKEKLEALNEEVPIPEKPMSLPGWGQWTDVQEKRGLPSWILEEHEIAKRNREDALKLRKDANLKHVVISERTNKKAEKFYTPTLPFPHKYEEVFEQSMRVPLGPDFNPAKSFRELNRPSVIKTPGAPINPIKFKEVNPLDSRSESHTGNENRKSFKVKGANKKNSMKKKQVTRMAVS